MDVLSTLVAYLQAPRAVHPRESSFHYPPVSAQFLAGVDAPPGYPSGYAPLRGNISQGMPLFSTNSMPVRAARSSMRGLPPWGVGGSSGSSGSITSHSSSVSSPLAMISPYPVLLDVLSAQGHRFVLSDGVRCVAMSGHRADLLSSHRIVWFGIHHIRAAKLSCFFRPLPVAEREYTSSAGWSEESLRRFGIPSA